MWVYWRVLQIMIWVGIYSKFGQTSITDIICSSWPSYCSIFLLINHFRKSLCTVGILDVSFLKLSRSLAIICPPVEHEGGVDHESCVEICPKHVWDIKQPFVLWEPNLNGNPDSSQNIPDNFDFDFSKKGAILKRIP